MNLIMSKQRCEESESIAVHIEERRGMKRSTYSLISTGINMLMGSLCSTNYSIYLRQFLVTIRLPIVP